LVALGCAPPGPAVESAKEVSILEQSSWITGRDGGQSEVAWGASVWTYGDTVLSAEDEDGLTWHHNSVSVTADTDASDGIGAFIEPADSVGAPRMFMPPNAEEQAFNDAHLSGEDGACAEEPCGARWAIWPGSPVWDEDNQQAYVPYGLIYAEPGDFNFEGVGQSIATWSDPGADPERPVVDESAEYPDLIWRPEDGGWGAELLLVDGDLYAFACDDDSVAGWFDGCRLGRAAVDERTHPSAWRYWDGSTWTTNPADAKSLFAGAPILSIAWNAYLERWLVVYSPPFDGHIYARAAEDLTGPWSNATMLYTTPEEDAPYDATHHAELAEEGGRVEYVTYHRSTDGWFGTEFAVIRVEFE
jgi:hypothetical protein